VRRVDFADQGTGRRSPDAQNVVVAGGEHEVFETNSGGDFLRSGFEYALDTPARGGNVQHRQFPRGTRVQPVSSQCQPGSGSGAFSGETRGGDRCSLGGIFGRTRAVAPTGGEEDDTA
jgi:hypothetical protein